MRVMGCVGVAMETGALNVGRAELWTRPLSSMRNGMEVGGDREGWEGREIGRERVIGGMEGMWGEVRRGGDYCISSNCLSLHVSA